MNRLEKDIEFVKNEGLSILQDQQAFHRRMADTKATATNSGSRDKAKMHSKRAAKFGELAMVLQSMLDELEKSEASSLAAPVVSTSESTFLRIGDIDELPEALRKQIKISESDKLDMTIIKSIDEFGGTAAIDEILVALWKETGEIHDRDYLARKIYRLTRNGTLKSAKRKGYFSIHSNSNEEPSNKDLLDDLV